MLRPIITIDEAKCDGCGQCVLDCQEGALQVINGKARLISETFCDGLGACLHCPNGALKLVERECDDFDASAVLAARAEREELEAAECQAERDAQSHAKNQAEGQGASLGSCAAAQSKTLSGQGFLGEAGQGQPLAQLSGKPLGQVGQAGQVRPLGSVETLPTCLTTWPIQLRLLNGKAAFLQGAKVLLAAHCTAFGLEGFRHEYLKDQVLIIACPKLEPKVELAKHLLDIVRVAKLQEINILRMSVPCCQGLERLVLEAMQAAGVNLPLSVKVLQVPRFG